jgi:indole-3-glycerol phosphate synthase
MMTGTFLDRMRKQKLQEIEIRQRTHSLAALRAKQADAPEVLDWREALGTRQRPALIAELKACSPAQQNVANPDWPEIVKEYEIGGAAAISILTDESYFGGSLGLLEQVSQLTMLPKLQKEFILGEYQLREGRLRGASAALILVYYFSEEELREIVNCCAEVGVTAVVECSLQEELPRALAINPDVLLLNNRPIAALPAEPQRGYSQGSVETTLQWWQEESRLRRWKQQAGKCLISASCIGSRVDIECLSPVPLDALLIGNAVMKASNRVEFLRQLQS